tara:strand:+ start:3310 stop:3702 length:393 start_codon:yes stop_codon:yes gene_type:complete
MYSKITLALSFVLLLASYVSAHEMTPAYPKLLPSYIDGVYVANMKLYNRRSDVEFYKIEVFTNDWKSIPFASTTKVINLKYKRSKLFSVYVRAADMKDVVYICTESKVFKAVDQVTLVSSRICSKIKQEQ